MVTLKQRQSAVTCRVSVNKAVYTAESVTCNWAGAVMRKLPKKRRKNKCVTDQPTDRPTNQPTNQRTDIVTYRVACTRLKRKADSKKISFRACKQTRLIWFWAMPLNVHVTKGFVGKIKWRSFVPATNESLRMITYEKKRKNFFHYESVRKDDNPR